jgi:hypothetical protein
MKDQPVKLWEKVAFAALFFFSSSTSPFSKLLKELSWSRPPAPKRYLALSFSWLQSFFFHLLSTNP